MRRTAFVLSLMIIMATSLGLTGCATIRTVPTLGSPGSPKVFSGTRLDFNAAAGNEAGLAKFSATPPAYPVIDLPFSALLDLFLLPLTLSVATYELVFE